MYKCYKNIFKKLRIYRDSKVIPEESFNVVFICWIW